MKKTVKIFLIISIVFLCNPFAVNAGSTRYSISVNTTNSNIYVAGGAVAVGLTLGILHVSMQGRAKNKTGGEPRFASLINFDLKHYRYSYDLPAVSIKGDTLYLPLIRWRF